MRRIVLSMGVSFACLMMLLAQSPPPLTDAQKAAVVNKLADILTEKYVFPETGKKMADQLRANLAAGKYASTVDPREFGARLTDDVFRVSRDLHLGVGYDPEGIRLQKLQTADNSTELDALNHRLGRARNFGFEEVKVLPGNVGYLKFNSFSSDPDAFPVAVGALTFLANVDALIVDLRENSGGDPVMIQLITSYFFDGEPQHLNTFQYREGNVERQFWTLPYVPGKKLAGVDLYVLTSNRTFSGAEEFSYNLKNMKRATLVGETTGGGAHPVKAELIDDNFTVAVPYGRAVNPISKTNWEGTGVAPDVKVAAARALDTARLLALEKLAGGEKDPGFKSVYVWHQEAMKAKLSPLALPEAAMKAYVGVYGPRRITLENGGLVYQREQRPKMKMTPLTPDCFLFEENPAFRVRFVREGDKVTAIEGYYENGQKDSSPRTE